MFQHNPLVGVGPDGYKSKLATSPTTPTCSYSASSAFPAAYCSLA